jgi:hypothetical protein
MVVRIDTFLSLGSQTPIGLVHQENNTLVGWLEMLESTTSANPGPSMGVYSSAI